MSARDAEAREFHIFSRRDAATARFVLVVIVVAWSVEWLLHLYGYMTGHGHPPRVYTMLLVAEAFPLSFFAFGWGLLAYARHTVYRVFDRQLLKVRPGGATTAVSLPGVTVIDVEAQDTRRVIAVHAPGTSTPSMGFGIDREGDNQGLMELLSALRQTEVGGRIDPLVVEMLEIWREANDADWGEQVGRRAARALTDLEVANFVRARRHFGAARKRGETLPAIAHRLDELMARLDL